MRYAEIAFWGALLSCAPSPPSTTGPFRPEIRVGWGATPILDGVISPGEYDDATPLSGVREWTPTFSPTTDDRDLSLQGWIKHDGESVYFAFRVTDDVLYGIDIPRWLPDNNLKAHELSPQGWPWFGDEMEILVDARRAGNYKDGQGCAGDGSSWQMVCNLTKSRLGGVGVGGLLEGEPRNKQAAWETYRRWIGTGAMQAAARVLPGGRGYVIEWRVKADPCLEVKPGVFWSPALGEVSMGLNIAVGDLDEKEKGRGNFGNFHHEDWWSGGPRTRTWLKEWGTMILLPGPRNP